MYNRKNNEQNLIEKSKNLLSNPVAFQYSASTMVEHWKYSAEMNLTDMSQNRRAWIGQATCCFEYQTPEHLTRIAWNQLSEKEQIDANKVAERVIKNWENDRFSENKVQCQRTIWE